MKEISLEVVIKIDWRVIRAEAGKPFRRNDVIIQARDDDSLE